MTKITDMSKAKKYAIVGSTIGGIGNATWNAIKQFGEMEKNPNQKFDWPRFLVAGGKGALVGGLSGGLIGAVQDHHNDSEKPLDTDAFLFKMASKLKLNKEDTNYLRLQQKADTLIALLKQEYSGKLASEPFRIGSTEKGTALRNKFDIDIALSFKKNSFRSTAEMFEDVADFLDSKAGTYSIIKVRNQTVSIGVFVLINQRECKIDIVPKKRTSANGKNKAGYLFVNNSNFWSKNSSYTKTDFQALKNVKFTESQKKIIIVLKHWKIKNNLPLSSHLLENLVVDAYEVNRYRIPRGLTNKVVMVLKHIAENLDVAFIRSVENTNNVLTNISPANKAAIINACVKVVEDYEYQPNSILDIIKK